MDQLAKDAAEAKRLGMRYGDYIAKYKPPQPPAMRYPEKKKPKEDQSKQEPPRCVVCGAEIPAGSKRTKACGPVCADALRRQQSKEWQEQKRKEKIAEMKTADTRPREGS